MLPIYGQHGYIHNRSSFNVFTFYAHYGDIHEKTLFDVEPPYIYINLNYIIWHKMS